MLDLARVFPGDSEMARRMRAMDWSATPVGAPEAWPQTLRTALDICLTSRFPMHVWWGSSLTFFYNDAYGAILGRRKHPAVLGRSGREVWAEVWDEIGPSIERVLVDRRASWAEDVCLYFDRQLPREEVFVTFSFSPVLADDGAVDGLFCVCIETTEKIVSRRRLETLHRLGQRASGAWTAEDACLAGMDVMWENPHDIPSAAVYLSTETGERRVVSATRDGGPDPRDARTVTLPIPGAAPDRPAGYLAVVPSATRPFDSGYRSFFELVASRLGTALAEARLVEEAQRQAEASAALDRAKTCFFSSVSHEFRTPLTLMLGPLEEAIERHPETKDLLTLVHRNSLRLLKLVNALLDFARIEEGRRRATYQPTDLAAFTTDLASVFRAAIESAGLRFVIECSTLPAPLYVDRDHWETIVLNLLSNALKFTFAGEIAVRLGERDGMAVLTVSDTGVGIPAAELPHIFDRFHRVEPKRARTHEGSGIGLCLVRELVQMHGGTIEVSSEEDRGATFTVAIPFGYAHLPGDQVAESADAHADVREGHLFVEEASHWIDTDTSVAASTPGAARILFADDNADMRQYVQRLLSAHYDVTAVADGATALAEVRRDLPDLVVADAMMPGLDGFELLSELRRDANTAAVPVILLSARAGEESRVEGLACGADDYLVKPFSARELLARISTHLSIQGVRRAAEQAARASADALERMNRRLVQAQEDERERIARDLHDDLGQQISALRLSLEIAASADPGTSAQHLARARLAADRLDADLTALARDLRGMPLDAIGFRRALEELVGEWSRRVAITADVTCDAAAAEALTREQERQLYRVVQEALRNIQRHAGAQYVDVLLQRSGEEVRLVIEDDGRGFDLETVGNIGMGLANIRARVQRLGGQFDIESAPGHGTALFVRVPLMVELP